MKLASENNLDADANSGAQAAPAVDNSQFFPTMELLAPLDTVHQLITRYISYMYPIFQVPHENVFQNSLVSRADQVDSTFLSLVGAMCAVTAQSYPRAARVISVGLEHPAIGGPGDAIAAAQDTQGMVDHFMRVAVNARGPAHGLRPDLDVNDATTSFLLAVTSSTAGNWQQYMYFMMECLATLNNIRSRRHTGESMVKNYVDLEMAARLQAAAFVHIQ
jgi:hypothetical protein